MTYLEDTSPFPENFLPFNNLFLKRRSEATSRNSVLASLIVSSVFLMSPVGIRRFFSFQFSHQTFACDFLPLSSRVNGLESLKRGGFPTLVPVLVLTRGGAFSSCVCQLKLTTHTRKRVLTFVFLVSLLTGLRSLCVAPITVALPSSPAAVEEIMMSRHVTPRTFVDLPALLPSGAHSATSSRPSCTSPERKRPDWCARL